MKGKAIQVTDIKTIALFTESALVDYHQSLFFWLNDMKMILFFIVIRFQLQHMQNIVTSNLKEFVSQEQNEDLKGRLSMKLKQLR